MLETLKEAVDRVQRLGAGAGYRDKLTFTFGVVVESDKPRQTKGSDLIQTVKLLDESMPGPVDLCIFCSRVDQMPRPQLGDVMELRFVSVQFYNEKPQLFAKMAPPHAFGFLLYRPAAVPAQPASEAAASAAVPHPVQLFNCAADSRHAAVRLQQLQALRQQVLGNPVTQDDGAVYLRRIRDLAPPEQEGQRPLCVDMRVQVLAIEQGQPDQESILYVWDATDARPIPASQHMLPSEWRGVELNISQPRRRSLPLVSQLPNVTVLQELPPLGTALPVIVQPGALAVLPQVGDWVKMKVVGLAAVQGQWQVVFGKCSRLTHSQPAAGFGTAYRTRLANQDTSEWPMDLQEVITTCSMPSLPRLTIRQVLMKTAQRQYGPFKVQLRLLGYLPDDLRQWCKRCPRPGGSKGSGIDGDGVVWEWAANLLLEDATGDLRALLLGDEATNVLGLPPHDLSHQDDVLQLQHALDYLSMVDDVGGVWMEVALTPLFSFSQDTQQQDQSRNTASPGQPKPSPAAPSGSQSSGQAAATAAAAAGDGSSAAEPLFVLHNAVCRAMEQQQQQSQHRRRDEPGIGQGPYDKRQCSSEPG